VNAFLDCTVKGTLLLLLTLALAIALRRASAATRHLLWALSLAGLLALPAVALVGPAWQLPVLPQGRAATEAALPVAGDAQASALPPRERPAAAPAVPAQAAVLPEPDAAPPRADTPAAVPPSSRGVWPSLSWQSGLLLGWGVGVALVLAPLFVGVVRLGLLAQRCRRVQDGGWLDLLSGLRHQLGLARRVRLLQGGAAVMPMTWGVFRPVLLLPAGADGWPAEQRRVVLLHELAHVKRLDCLTQVIARLACALYWFHPLVWLVAARLRDEREQACDDAVIAAGARASEYAGHLLTVARTFRAARLAPCAAVAMARPSQLEGRLRAILDGRRDRRRPGRLLTGLAGILVVALVVPLAALRLAARAAEAPRGPDAPPAGEQKEYTASGIVHDASGKPLAGAAVYWAVTNDTDLHVAALPKDARETPRADLLGSGTTDAEGKFSLKTSLPAADTRLTDSFAVVVARATGLAYTGTLYRPDRKLELTLTPEMPIEGKLLGPNGEPAKGVKVRLQGFLQVNGVDPMDGWGITSPLQAGGKLTDLPGWPSAVTDDQGKFTLPGLGKGVVAHLELTSDEFAWEQLQVIGRDGLAGVMSKLLAQGPGPRPLEPKFSHALDSARPVQGVVTDAETGKPLAGMLVEVVPMQRHGGRSLTTRTDEQGRYRVNGPQGESYWFSAHPPGDSGYLGVEVDDSRGWPPGAKFLEKNFALKKGRVIRGQVTDAESGKPVAGAAVVYRPKRDNPNRVRNTSFNNPVLTDAAGRFALTGYAGAGFVLVEAPGADYVRRQVNRAETGTGEDWLTHGFAAVDAPGDGEAEAVVVKVRKGVTLEVKALDPDGQPLPFVNAFCREEQVRGFDHYSNYGGDPRFAGVFRFRGAEPGRTYRIFFAQADRGLAKALEVEVPADGKGQSLEVRLEPAAKVKARVVRADGTPVEGGDVVASLLVSGEKGEVKADELYGSSRILWYANFARTLLGGSGLVRTNARGEFECSCLVPGVRNFVRVGINEGAVVKELADLKPGETRDLGMIQVKKEEP
jgi:beta-lactamase regulating signal transducer with metallopeptidase domain